MDGYLSIAGVQTFYILGEWFLGLIILFYILFPILRTGVKYHPWITACIAGILYFFTLALNRPFLGIPHSKLLITRLPELVFGMYFIHYRQNISQLIRLPHWILTFGIAFLLGLQQIFKPLSGDLAVACIGVSCFLLLTELSKKLDGRPISGVVHSLSKYSYPILPCSSPCNCTGLLDCQAGHFGQV